MAVMKTPGVYIVEKNAFPNSVVEVATAVPAFIGYTEKAVNGNKSLLNQPWRITSMAEFRTYFGGAPLPQFAVEEAEAGAGTISFNGKYYAVKRQDAFTLYYNLLLFYVNGGGPCYIVSVGDYAADGIDKAKLEAGILPLVKEQEPTMAVIPEAVNLSDAADCYALQQAVLNHCGNVMKNRFAILDIYGGAKDRKDPDGDVVNNFREAIGSNFLDYGAVYYPWVNTSIVQENEISFLNLDIENLKTLLAAESDASNMPDAKKVQVKGYIDSLKEGLSPVEQHTLHKVFSQISPVQGDYKGNAFVAQLVACFGSYGRRLHAGGQQQRRLESPRQRQHRHGNKSCGEYFARRTGRPERTHQR